MSELDDLRLIEIGPVPFVKAAFPDRTAFFQTSARRARAGQEPGEPVGMGELWRRLSGDVDLVVVHADSHAPWSLSALVRLVFNRRLFTETTLPHRPYGPQLLRFRRGPPVAVVDFADTPYVEASQFFLMDRATLFFKRELPPDEFRVFTKTGTATQPSARYRRKRRTRERIAKLRPLSLGLPRGVEREVPQLPVEKTTDVFFSAWVEGLRVRERALAELRELEREGYRIDVPPAKIGREEFYRRCAAAWITLSPEGYGWDCFRHYEAGACGSVPLMNTPTILRHRPHREGVDGLFYIPEPGGLAAAVRRALADREALRRIGAAAREHVLGNHTSDALARYVVEETLAATASRK